MNSELTIDILLAADSIENNVTNLYFLNNELSQFVYPMNPSAVEQLKKLVTEGYLENTRIKYLSNNEPRSVYLGQLTEKGKEYLEKLLFPSEKPERPSFISNYFYGAINNLQQGNGNNIYGQDNKAVNYQLGKIRFTKYGQRIFEALQTIKPESDELINDISLELGFNSGRKFEKQFMTNKYPNFKAMRWLSNRLGINYGWLLKEKDNMFSPEIESLPVVEKTVNDYDQYFFIIKNEERYREILVVHQKEKYRYNIYKKTLLFNSQVGGEGRRRLVEETYSFLKAVQQQRLNDIAKVIFVSSDKFIQIKKGLIYPGNILNSVKDENILDDFVDGEINCYDQGCVQDIQNIYNLIYKKIRNSDNKYLPEDIFKSWKYVQ
ncbi:MAG: hypothetical protein N4R38_03260 [Lactobacillus crispatus]|nr:hypothetical protein [Lactobacillus crispatus]